MSLTMFWRCEGLTFDGTHDYSAGDTTATLINSGAIDTTSVKYGTNGLDAPGSVSGGATFTLASNGIFPGTLTSPSDFVGSFGFWMYWPTSVFASSGSSVGFKFQGTAANDYIQVHSATGGQNLTLALRNATNGLLSLTTSGNAITADAWFFVLCRLNFANDDRRIEIYNASGTLVDYAEDLSTDLASYVPADIKSASGLVLGQHPASHTTATYYDNFFIANTYNEPIELNMTITSYADYRTSWAHKLVGKFGGKLRGKI